MATIVAFWICAIVAQAVIAVVLQRWMREFPPLIVAFTATALGGVVGFAAAVVTAHPSVPWPLVCAVYPLPAYLIAGLAATVARRSLPAEPGPGCCRNCGYDLTGNTSGRCPECGRRVGSDGRQP
ncbi:MAG: hypothetical protein IT450_21540 [Phycisphaerales bacterium]|nr:hypothetical protein [Phycisphaerales bacterium]